MKIVIVGGGGAMGGVWASRLHAAGQEVAILDVSPEALAAINGEGLVVERKDGSTTATRVPASDDAAAIGPADAIIFFTKAHHTAAAAERARPLVEPRTTVVSLQNGWGNSDTLATVFPPEQIVMGVTYHSATLRAPGRVAHTNDVGADLRRAVRRRRPARPGAGDRRRRWSCRRSTTTVTAAVKTRGLEEADPQLRDAADRGADPPDRRRAGPTRTVARPGRRARDRGDRRRQRRSATTIDAAERIATIHELLSRRRQGQGSMLQDVEGRRKTEIEVINGAVVREGDPARDRRPAQPGDGRPDRRPGTVVAAMSTQITLPRRRRLRGRRPVFPLPGRSVPDRQSGGDDRSRRSRRAGRHPRLPRRLRPPRRRRVASPSGPGRRSSAAARCGRCCWKRACRRRRLRATTWGSSTRSAGSSCGRSSATIGRRAGWPDGQFVTGVPMGFIVETEPGIRIYHYGDTAIFSDLKLIGELYRPTIGLLGCAQPGGTAARVRGSGALPDRRDVAPRSGAGGGVPRA